jgi:signal transduction histidine kinase
MRPSTPLANDTQGRLLAFVFTLVIGSFFGSTILVREASTDADRFADSIISNSTPSIAELASVRAVVFEVELALSRYIHEQSTAMEADLESSQRSLGRHVSVYLKLPMFPQEQAHWSEVQRAWIAFDDAVRKTRETADAGRTADALQSFARNVEPYGDAMVDAAMRSIEFNAEQGRSLAMQIKESRARASILSNILAVFCAVLGIAGALLIYRQATRRRAEMQAHSALIEARADELEQFAGRVAHDIRNPLSSAAMACELLAHAPPNAKIAELASRIRRSLGRADAIIGGLLEFARSGARPDPGARTNVQEAIADLASGASQQAESLGIELQFETAPEVMVACSRGVYLSLLGNLVRNAMKYMDEQEPRRIVVRVELDRSYVLTSVSDTGPGISSESLDHLFEPYFRGTARGRDGLGLGLATVKKLAEGHGGKVGVRSALGEGSTFWFALPHAGSADVAGGPEVVEDRSALLH